MRARSWLVAVAAVVVCVGCGGDGDERTEERAVASSSASASASPVAGAASPTEASTTPATASAPAAPGQRPQQPGTVRPDPPRDEDVHAAPPPPESGRTSPPAAQPTRSRAAIRVAGPTLNSDFPAAFGVFPDPGSQCALISLSPPPDVPLAVAGTHASPPFRVAAGGCRQDGPSGVDAPPCTGFTFLGEDDEYCSLLVELPAAADGTDLFAHTLTVVLAGTCAAPVGPVCGELPAGTSVPVPVEVARSWPLKACLDTVADDPFEEFGDGGGETYLLTDARCRLPAAGAGG